MASPMLPSGSVTICHVKEAISLALRPDFTDKRKITVSLRLFLVVARYCWVALI